MNMNVKNGIYTIKRGEETEEKGFNYYTNLKASDKLKFVNGVTNLIIDDNNYSPIIADMMFDFEIVNIFTDIDLSEIIEAPNNIDRIEDFLNETNIVEIVVKNAESGLIDSLRKAINDDIEYKTGIHKNALSDALADLVRLVEKKVEDIDISKLMSMAETVSSLTGEITPEKMLNAYANTDMFKRNSEKRENKFEVVK